MNNRLYVTFWLLLCCVSLSGIHARQWNFRIMEYNVENLFDTLHASGKLDTDFTPEGSLHWTSARYWAKLGRLARVIAAVGGATPPDLVALEEVENDSVLTHLTRRTHLAMLGYDYVITRSADARGINVALLYQPARFRPVSVDTFRVVPLHSRLPVTRDVLHVAGELPLGDTLDIFVCHLPSRRNGRQAEQYRNRVCRLVRQKADSLCAVRQKPSIVLTGDFNAMYPEKCFTDCLGASLPDTAVSVRHQLYLLSNALQGRQGIAGTYKYRGEWNRLDHMLVNGRLLSPSAWEGGLRCSPSDCCIADFDFLLRADTSGMGVQPFSTFLGTFYAGGYSDHLPLVLTLHWAD